MKCFRWGQKGEAGSGFDMNLTCMYAYIICNN